MRKSCLRFQHTIATNAERIEKQCLLATYTSTGQRMSKDLVFVSGKGVSLYDQYGTRYLDMNAGIAVNILGHAHDKWIAAITDQIQKVSHVSNLYHSTPPLHLACQLVENTKLDKVFFCNSGTEANEGAYKFARLFGNGFTQRKSKIVAFTGGFHGRTVASLSMTYKPEIREPFMPLIPDIEFATFNDLHSVKKLLEKKDVAAVIVEPIQGEGGVHVATLDFLQGLRTLCTEAGSLLICDEVQSGLGRTGALFAHTAYDILPDIVTLAKPLAGGLPIGAVLVQEHVAEYVTPGMHGSTFGGNPVVCRAATVVMDHLLDKDFMANVQARGKQLSTGLHTLAEQYPEHIAAIRVPVGECGLFAAIECRTPVAPFIEKALQEHRMLLISAGTHVIRLCPPLIVTKMDIQELLQILGCLFSETSNK